MRLAYAREMDVYQESKVASQSKKVTGVDKEKKYNVPVQTLVCNGN
jgi:hypothetical protein